jgi:hypothetical protein
LKSSAYTDGEYLRNNPDWHDGDSQFKAQQVLKMIARQNLLPERICEIGCGAGGILRTLHDSMSETCCFHGYDVSPQAIALAAKNRSSRLCFSCEDVTPVSPPKWDLVLVMDVIEHVEDYFTFLRKIQAFGILKIFHIPLDITAQGTLRNSLSRGWDDVGHIHSFTKDLALKAVRYCGYEILDYFYTSRADMPFNNWKLKAAGVPRRLTFAIHQDLAVRMLGGYSIMILAR